MTKHHHKRNQEQQPNSASHKREVRGKRRQPTMLYSDTYPLVSLWSPDNDATPCTGMMWCMTVTMTIFKKGYCHGLFHLSKNMWARMKVQVFRGRNQNSQQYRVQHQDRIECSLNDGFKGFPDKHQGLAITGKSTMLLPKQIQGKDQGFDWNYKLRSTIRFRHDPTHSIYKRFSQPRLG